MKVCMVQTLVIAKKTPQRLQAGDQKPSKIPVLSASQKGPLLLPCSLYPALSPPLLSPLPLPSTSLHPLLPTPFNFSNASVPQWSQLQPLLLSIAIRAVTMDSQTWFPPPASLGRQFPPPSSQQLLFPLLSPSRSNSTFNLPSWVSMQLASI